MSSLALTTRTGDGLALGPDLVDAAHRAADAALAQLGPGPAPDLAFVWVSGGTAEQTDAALQAAYDVLGAATTLGSTAHGVLGAGRAVEADRAVSVWAARLPGVSLRSFHLEVLRTSDAIAVVGMPERRVDDVVGVLLADPWSFPVDGFVGRSYDALRGLPLVGGLASGSVEPGATRLLVDGRVVDRGAVGVVLGGEVAVRTVVAQGCRPIGRPMTVTAADGTRVTELAGHSPLVQARIAIDELPDDAQDMAVDGLHLGVAMDEYAHEHGPGDFVARGLLAADELDGSLAIEDAVEVGSTVQFLLRDAAAAHDDLVDALEGLRREVGADGLAGALLFAGDGRGREMFGTPGHDLAAVRAMLGLEHVGGCFTSGEIAPVGGRNHVHGVTATLLAFRSTAR